MKNRFYIKPKLEKILLHLEDGIAAGSLVSMSMGNPNLSTVDDWITGADSDLPQPTQNELTL